MSATAILSILLTSLVVGARFAAAASANAGSFSVLTFNVAGLPAILQGNDVPGDKTTNTQRIGSLFAQYNYGIINVQEDFNYHASLYETDTHPFRTATSGGVPFGSGLNTLSSYPFVDFERVKWGTCSDASENDCLTPKGFTSMRVRLDEGVYIDMINVHTDAGTEPGDLAARSANIQQVVDWIDTQSVGNAAIVFGDTNSRYTRALDSIRVFGIQNGMTDAWVQLTQGGTPPAAGADALLCTNPSTTNTCETVDKVIYRGNKMINLQAVLFNYESNKFLQPNGSILSDHNPITTNFNYTLSSTLKQSDMWGGPHGTWFNDLPNLPSSFTGANKPTVINFRGDQRLNSVGITLQSGATYTHGGNSGNPYSLTLTANEFWTQAQLCAGSYNGETRNFYIKATTSAGRTLAAGKTTDSCQNFAAPSGWQIVGYFGQDGDEMDQLGFIYALQ